MKLTRPWWWCCGWWSPWCVLDTLAHRLGLPLDADLADEDEAPDHPYYWICRRHDAAVQRYWEKQYPDVEEAA